jgi:hypothetical protein
MEIDAKFVLYSVIEKMGRENIESIASMPSVKKVMQEIFASCMNFLRSYAYDREKMHADLVVALMHYMLSTCMIQAERKVEYEKLTLDIVIPSAKQLKTDPQRTLLIVFPDVAQTDTQMDSLQKIQPYKENIWLVFGNYTDELMNVRSFRTYVPDDHAKEHLQPLSSIIDDIRSFLEVHKVRSFKIFPT